jgi:hypothetical protein
LYADIETCNRNDSIYQTIAFALTFAFATKHIGKRSKSKRECKQPHLFAAGRDSKQRG